MDYQSLSDDQIGDAAWSEAKANDGKDGDGNEIFHYRVDVLWYFILFFFLLLFRNPGGDVLRQEFWYVNLWWFLG